MGQYEGKFHTSGDHKILLPLSLQICINHGTRIVAKANYLGTYQVDTRHHTGNAVYLFPTAVPLPTAGSEYIVSTSVVFW